MVSRQALVRLALLYSCWARGRVWDYNGERQRPRCSRDGTGALAAIAGLKTRHYNGEKQVPRLPAQAGCARDDAGAGGRGKGEGTQRGTVLGAIVGHGSLQKERLDLGFVGGASRRRGAVLNKKSLLER